MPRRRRTSLIEGDIIAEIGRPGMAAPAAAKVVDARGRLLHPGLINGHTHSHANLAKGMVDRVTLELLLTAGPWMSGQRTLEDKYLSSLIGAAEMVLKGCTAAYDLTGEFGRGAGGGRPGLRRRRDAGGAGADGRGPELLRSLAGLDGASAGGPAQGRRALRARSVQGERALHGWKLAGKGVELAVAPTIPHHCSPEFLLACLKLSRDYGTGLHTHVADRKCR